MFRHDRVYRAIALSGPDFDDLGSVRALLPPKCLSVVEPAVADEHLRAEHYYYYSRTAFTRNIDVLQKARAKWNGVEQYRYNIYFVGIRYRRQFVAFVAVPFWKMAREVYPHIRAATRGRSVVFRKVALEQVFRAAKAAEELAAILKISRVLYGIEGDVAADSLEFAGEDLARCDTLETLKANLKGPSLVPQSVRLAYKRSFEERFTVEADKFGHYRFRVGKSGRTFACLTGVCIALTKSQLIEATPAFPYMGRGDPEDELEEGE